MSSAFSSSCWTDPRLQKQHEREFVQHFSSNKYPYGVSRNDYDALIKRVGNTFGPNDKIRNTFEVKDCCVNGEWVVRLVDKEQKRILLPLEDVFAEIESGHIKGNHKAKTPLHTEMKQNLFYPSRPMLEFVLDRCPKCLERKKKPEAKVPDEPVHPNPVPPKFRKDNASYQRKESNVPQDPVSVAPKSFCMNSPIPAPGKAWPSSMDTPSGSTPNFLTSTPVAHNNYEPFAPHESAILSLNLSLPNDAPSDTFIRFMNTSSNNQSGQQYMNIIREELTVSHTSDKEMDVIAVKKAERQRDGNGRESSQKQRTLRGEKSTDRSMILVQNACEQKVFPLNVPIKKETECSEDLSQENFFLSDEEKIMLDLEKECFGKWSKIQSRKDASHHYYYHSQTGVSQNETPPVWLKEIKKRIEEKMTIYRSGPATDCFELGGSKTDKENANNKNKNVTKLGEAQSNAIVADTSISAEVSSFARPFNDTNDVMEVLLADQDGKTAQNAAPAEEEMDLRDICDQFQDELFEILDAGTVSFTLQDPNQANVSTGTENLNLENIPLGESIGAPCLRDGNERHIGEQQKISNQNQLKGNSSKTVLDCAGEAAPSAVSFTSVPTPKINRDTIHLTTICTNKIKIPTQKRIAQLTLANPENSTSFGFSKVQTARKRSLRLRGAVAVQMIRSSSESESSEGEESDVKRPPPILTHKMPRCKVLVERLSKTSAQRLLHSRAKRNSEFFKTQASLSSNDDVSPSPKPNNSRRNTRTSTAHSQNVKQEIFQCVKCTRTRTFIGEIAYHLHELARHRNCVSAKQYVIDYMDKLMPLSLKEVSFCCLLCDQTFDCAEYWKHMQEKHNAEIGTRHQRISNRINDAKEGKIQKFNIKSEFLSDYEDEDDLYAKDETWNGRDGEWTKLALGKSRRSTAVKSEGGGIGGRKSGGKRVKTELIE